MIWFLVGLYLVLSFFITYIIIIGCKVKNKKFFYDIVMGDISELILIFSPISCPILTLIGIFYYIGRSTDKIADYIRNQLNEIEK